MIQGMSYLKLYYNKACTKELEKDEQGNYVYNSKNISNNAIMPLIINLWCKNEGSHTAYEVIVRQISSDLSLTMPEKVEKIYSNQIVALPIKVNIDKGDTSLHILEVILEYDSI